MRTAGAGHRGNRRGISSTPPQSCSRLFAMDRPPQWGENASYCGKTARPTPEFTVIPGTWWPNGYGAQPLYNTTVSPLRVRAGQGVTKNAARVRARLPPAPTRTSFPRASFAVVVNGQENLQWQPSPQSEDNIRGHVTAELCADRLPTAQSGKLQYRFVRRRRYHPDDAVPPRRLRREYGILRGRI